MYRFEEHQGFASWVYAVVVISELAVLPVLLVIEDAVLAGSIAAGMILLTVWTVNILFLRTWVDQHELKVQLGWFLPIWFPRRIPLGSMRTVRAVTYRPLRDAGGWGLRFGKFEGEFCMYYNARGDEGVLIETDEGKRLIVGSQRPEELAAALKESG